jgi:hypothetical protein
MDTIVVQKNLDNYSTDSLNILRRHFDLPRTSRQDLLWLLAIYQAQNNQLGKMRGAPEPRSDLPRPRRRGPRIPQGVDKTVEMFKKLRGQGGAAEVFRTPSPSPPKFNMISFD